MPSKVLKLPKSKQTQQPETSILPKEPKQTLQRQQFESKQTNKGIHHTKRILKPSAQNKAIVHQPNPGRFKSKGRTHRFPRKETVPKGQLRGSLCWYLALLLLVPSSKKWIVLLGPQIELPRTVKERNIFDLKGIKQMVYSGAK